MNPVETFGEFSQKITNTDLMLYAGIGIVLWVLFKDKLSPAQKMITDLLGKLNGKNKTNITEPTIVSKPNDVISKTNPDVFFDLVVSWKHTRDLAVLSGCTKAVEVADQMFPYLSPTVCKEIKDELPKTN